MLCLFRITDSTYHNVFQFVDNKYLLCNNNSKNSFSKKNIAQALLDKFSQDHIDQA